MPHPKFNIAHIVPDANTRSAHGLLGYTEVVETLLWGLRDIGYDATTTRNSVAADRINIVLGAQMLTDAQLQDLPESTIIYNFEQVARVSRSDLKPQIATVAERFKVWDYSQANVEAWNAIRPRRAVTTVPVGWAPILARISANVPQDIDVLFYGLPGQVRLEVFYDLCIHGMTCVFACGLYGAARDELIARSKLILNINQYESRIFEIVRVSYLLANAKAVVADIQPDTFIEAGVEAAVQFCEPKRMFAECSALLENRHLRYALELRGQKFMQTRHISSILREALAETGIAN